jgi:hypothetical protein
MLLGGRLVVLMVVFLEFRTPDSGEVAAESGGVEAVRSVASEGKFVLPIFPPVSTP